MRVLRLGPGRAAHARPTNDLGNDPLTMHRRAPLRWIADRSSVMQPRSDSAHSGSGSFLRAARSRAAFSRNSHFSWHSTLSASHYKWNTVDPTDPQALFNIIISKSSKHGYREVFFLHLNFLVNKKLLIVIYDTRV